MNLKEYKQEFEERGIKVKIDGGLYSEDGQTLYVAPKKQTVHVNEGCKYIAPHAFQCPTVVTPITVWSFPKAS